MKKQISLLATVGLGLTFFGCGGDDLPSVTAPESTTTLTEAQAESMVDLLGMEALIGTFANMDPTSPRLDIRAQTYNFDETYSGSVNCLTSGTVDIAGSYSGSVSDTSGNIDFDMTESFDQCTATEGTDEMTVDGDLTFAMEMTFSGESGNVSGTIIGSLTVSGTGIQTGICGIGLAFTGSGGAGGGSGSISGTVCGIDISESMSIN